MIESFGKDDGRICLWNLLYFEWREPWLSDCKFEINWSITFTWEECSAEDLLFTALNSVAVYKN